MAQSSETTTIQISYDTWMDLNSAKDSPQDTFDDVIQELLENE